jgi:hypothetical protein
MMRIVIDHDQCKHGGAFSDRCLGATIRYPLGHERYCLAELEEDGQPELTVVLRMEGQEFTITLRDEAEQQAAALEGWLAFPGAAEAVQQARP